RILNERTRPPSFVANDSNHSPHYDPFGRASNTIDCDLLYEICRRFLASENWSWLTKHAGESASYNVILVYDHVHYGSNLRARLERRHNPFAREQDQSSRFYPFDS